MTISIAKAKRALSDADSAYSKFQDNPIDVDFRHLIVLCLTLLRVVGHVVDKENSGESKKKVNAYYKAHIKNVDLFRFFIEEYRNNLLKTYTSKISWQSMTTLDNEHRMDYLLEAGHYAGRDIRDLIKESIAFWDDHLDKIAQL